MGKCNTFLIMAGGTGGHVFPALATARMLQEQGVNVHWLGSENGMEVEWVSAAGIPISCISISGLRGKGKLALLTAPFRLVNALLQALSVVRAVKPDGVLGMGGFVTGPGGLAARLMGKPLLIHEQNAVAGMTNKLLSRFASRVMEAFPGSFPQGVNTVVTGNPVRKEICNLPAKQACNVDGRRPRVLVVGGSLGAVAINQVVPEAIKLSCVDMGIDVTHQAGKNNLEATIANYKRAGVEANVVPFISDMKSAYEWADIVICRAGALTISELCMAGVGAILIPYPYAVDDHQTKNAGFMVDAGAAELMPQNELTALALHKKLKAMIEKTEIMTSMAQAARNLARPDATEKVVSYCMEACNG
ncbi:undecaprenyldiphospho-muramoylpentapeptide beta-N-acetylglucosaminyltransferase [Alkalimarinus coralli]|uniref:undecaprenyldiphospho-muramoylpentapeptide beta-N-acetylglucosaminyltransferase n=1 Tax=Alkalimarinus coralli TaxID=2935863 RepID=UPI00202ADA8A|nr:undecaprenyldiphospho-muramoylpentapeptide beta-N-acetylglucosaminyltransferase [Alkalimarinus coralli]